ncbi:hypothetical protein HQ49_06105 [Porphyromonas gulae]|nr:hypothetical protein HQ49_06105 [Porphyromonas gulae]
MSEYRATAPKTSQQSLAKEGGNLEEIVPQGWKVSHATGDLSKDRFPDIALVAQPQDKSKIKLRNDGREHFCKHQLLYFEDVYYLLKPKMRKEKCEAEQMLRFLIRSTKVGEGVQFF